VNLTFASRWPVPPPGVRGAPQLVRMHDDLIKAIDKWRGPQDVTRPEVIRQLVEIGLKAKSK